MPLCHVLYFNPPRKKGTNKLAYTVFCKNMQTYNIYNLEQHMYSDSYVLEMSRHYLTQLIQGMLRTFFGTCIFRSSCRPCCSSRAHLSHPDEPKLSSYPNIWWFHVVSKGKGVRGNPQVIHFRWGFSWIFHHKPSILWVTPFQEASINTAALQRKRWAAPHHSSARNPPATGASAGKRAQLIPPHISIGSMDTPLGTENGCNPQTMHPVLAALAKFCAR